MLKNIYGVLIFILNVGSVYGGVSRCCLKTSGICRKKCELLKVPQDAKKFTRRWRKLTDIVAKCPRGEINFWKCLPTTNVWKEFLAASKRRTRKPNHSICCKDANHLSCEILCRTSRNVTKLLYNANCNRIREPKLSQCVAKIHASKQCCHGAPTTDCRDACMRYFRRSHNLDGKSALERKCGIQSHQYKCVMKQSDYKDVIDEYTTCCTQAPTKRCTRACQKELQQLQNMTVFFARLKKVCGRLNMQNPMYKCITQTSMGPETQTPVNEPQRRDRTAFAGKGPEKAKGCCKQCCYRAKSVQCRKWCNDMTASPSLMGLWDTMYLSCWQDPKEMELSNCMYDILEPCQIGVKSEMKFCTNFNNRPLELFRRCDRHGDNEARELYKLWSDGIVPVSGFNLVLKDVRKCKPEMFKAMACLISIKPCDHHSSRRQVCRSDCEELLHACLDHDKLDATVNVRLLCAAMLSKENQTGCISVRDYLQKPPTIISVRKNEVTQPCDGNPCGNRSVCTINRDCVGFNKRRGFCKPYTCSEGCRQGNLMVPVGQLAKLREDNGDRECYQVCKCERSWGEESFTYFGNCLHFDCKKKRKCILNQMIFNDGEIISTGCNTCTCEDGELLCTKRYCGHDFHRLPSGRPRRHHTLPMAPSTLCDCGDVYEPGCDGSGSSYSNPCVARCCSEDARFNVGTCNFVDPCKSNPCPSEQKCIPKRSVLLKKEECPQYTCSLNLRDSTGCYRHRHKESDIVCGYDGVTYNNKCLASASGTGIDYHGSCVSHSKIGKHRCKDVICPRMPEGNCHLFQPPGACCPLCGSMLRILYSHRDIDSHREYISNDPITVIDIVKQLRQLQRVAQCSLYGHRSVQGDLVVLIVVNTRKPTRRQVHACATEAERINKYINYGSPVVTTFYHLSILKVSRLKKAKWKDNNSSASRKLHNFTQTYAILFLCTLLVNFLSRNR